MGNYHEKQKEFLMKYIHPKYNGMYKDKDTGELMAKVSISIDDDFMNKICWDMRKYYVEEHKKKYQDKKPTDIKSTGVDMIEAEKIGKYICDNILKAIREEL